LPWLAKSRKQDTVLHKLKLKTQLAVTHPPSADVLLPCLPTGLLSLLTLPQYEALNQLFPAMSWLKADDG